MSTYQLMTCLHPLSSCAARRNLLARPSVIYWCEGALAGQRMSVAHLIAEGPACVEERPRVDGVRPAGHVVLHMRADQLAGLILIEAKYSKSKSMLANRRDTVVLVGLRLRCTAVDDTSCVSRKHARVSRMGIKHTLTKPVHSVWLRTAAPASPAVHASAMFSRESLNWPSWYTTCTFADSVMTSWQNHVQPRIAELAVLGHDLEGQGAGRVRSMQDKIIYDHLAQSCSAASRSTGRRGTQPARVQTQMSIAFARVFVRQHTY